MSKKSNPEKGLPSVTIELDKPRTLRWNNKETREFEEWILQFFDFPRSGIKQGTPTKSNPTGLLSMSAEYAIMNMLNTVAVQTRALFHSLRSENGDIDSIAKIDDLITDYKASGQSWDDLLIAIQRSFLLANDPSSLASHEVRWKALHDLAKINAKVAAKIQENAEKEIAEQMKKAEKTLAELDSGETPPGSPTA